MSENVKELILSELKKAVKSYDSPSYNRGYIEINPKDILTVVSSLYNTLSARFITATGFDTSKEFEIFYHFDFDKYNYVLTAKVALPRENPMIQSISKIFDGALWIEREMHELLGIDFIGHPDLKHLLLPEEWEDGNYPYRREERNG